MTAVPTRRARGAKPSSLRYYQDGPPAPVDLTTYRLRFSGIGVPDVSLSWADLQSLPRVDQNRRRVCVCNWSIRESWSGVLLEAALEWAGWDGNPAATFVKQVSIGTPEKGVYDSTIPLAGALERAALLADRLDGEPLGLERGYPLRLLDFGLYSYKGVKGLASLTLTDSQDLGVWERKAGYTVNGEIQPKRYRMCDLGDHRFVERPGEVSQY